MNLLIEKAPDYLKVRGITIKIKTDFTLWVRFIIACENKNSEEIGKALLDIFGGVPQVTYKDDMIQAVMLWLYHGAGNKETGQQTKTNASAVFDFEVDGNVIYCELWQYFPHLMARGISYHEGVELIKLLLHNENTMLWHRGFARCGDFSSMSKEQKTFWQKERAKYQLPVKNRLQNQQNIDDIMSRSF